MNILKESIQGKATGTRFDMLPPDVNEIILRAAYKHKFDQVTRVVTRPYRNIKTRRNDSVITAWLLGVKHECGNLSTDGERLFSYDLMIGMKHFGRRVVLDYTAKGISCQSHTTSCHVNKAKAFAARVVADSSELRDILNYCHSNYD